MAGDFGYVIGLGLFALAIVVALGVGYFIVRELRKGQPVPQSRQVADPAEMVQATNPKSIPPDNARLSPQAPMSYAEGRMRDFLVNAVDGRYLVETKVPLADIITRSGWLERGLWTMHKFGHVDFLLLEPRTKLPVLAIELDDATHNDPARRERDRRKDELLRRANLRLIRFKKGKVWADEERLAIRMALPPDPHHSTNPLPTASVATKTRIGGSG